MSDSKNEIWKPIPDTDGKYEASSLGRVRAMWRLSRLNQRYELEDPVILKSKRDYLGYECITLRVPKKSGATMSYKVHRLVMLAFKPEGNGPKMQVAHANGVRDDNRLENLVWATAQENADHKQEHGTSRKGERNASAKLSNVAAMAVRNLAQAGFPQKVIADAFGIAEGTISAIKNGSTWKDVGCAKCKEHEARIPKLESLAKFNIETAHALLKERDEALAKVAVVTDAYETQKIAFEVMKESALGFKKERDYALAGNRSLHEINSSLDSKFMLLQAEHSLALAKLAELEKANEVLRGTRRFSQIEELTAERDAALDRIKNLRAALEFYTPLAIRFNNGELASNTASRALADDDAAQAKGAT